MQKGRLDKEDYIWLFILVLAYFQARPYIQKLFKYIFESKDLREGEQAQQEYIKAKIQPNAIRSSKDFVQDSKLEKVEEVTTSGSKIEGKGQVKNRKTGAQSGTTTSEESKLLDWEDEPARKPNDGDKEDVMAWLDRWDS